MHVALARTLPGSRVTRDGAADCAALVARAREAAFVCGTTVGVGVGLAPVAVVTFNSDLAATMATKRVTCSQVVRVGTGSAVRIKTNGK